jgi:hypothetical protein
MADHFYGINRGKLELTPVSIVRGTSTGSTDIELRVADAAGLTRKDVIIALEALEALFAQPGSSPDGTNFPVI